MTDVKFWNNIARGYAKRPISNVPAYEQTLAHVRQHLRADHRALEVGCGTGSTALLLAPSVERYTGTDVSPEMIDIANEKQAIEVAQGLDFVVSNAELDAFEPQSVDVLLAFNLYHLVPDLDQSLKAAHRTLAQDGLFISKTPCIAGRWYLRPIIKAMQLIGKAPYLNYLSVRDFDAAVKRAGFEIMETAVYGSRKDNRFIVARKR